MEQCENMELRKISKNVEQAPKQPKSFWTTECLEWSNEKFKERLRLNRTSFEFILNCVRALIVKQQIDIIPNPIEEHRQLALTIYRLAHSFSFNFLKDSFGLSQSLATEYFNKVIKVMAHCLCNEFVKTLQTEEEWVNEYKCFMENYEFRCVGA